MRDAGHKASHEKSAHQSGRTEAGKEGEHKRGEITATGRTAADAENGGEAQSESHFIAATWERNARGRRVKRNRGRDRKIRGIHKRAD